MNSEDKKEEVRAAADIYEVVSDYVQLKRSGSGFTGLCPYHNEKTPSFHVNPKLQIFKCFGCGETGDVFKIVMDQEGVSFPEALKKIADRYGIHVPEKHFIPENTEEIRQKEGVMHALTFAGMFFHRQLKENGDGEKARNYLSSRGFKSKTIANFGLGFSPGDGNALLHAARSAGISEEYLLEADLVKPSQHSGDFYDTFRDRLMFPIFNIQGKAIAFAGRVLGDSKTAKYINSAQTKVYNKSEVVYGLNFAKNEIRRTKEVILVEGYTDVIMLHQNGIENVVASSGTALTSQQLSSIKRFADVITMLFDSDQAGQNAMIKGLNLALQQNLDVRMLELPDGEDPDSFVKQFGKEAFFDVKKRHETDFVQYLIHQSEKNQKLDDPSVKARLITSMLEVVAYIPDEIKRQVYVQHLHQHTQHFRKGSDRELFDELNRILAGKRKAQQQTVLREQRRNNYSSNQEEFRHVPESAKPQKLSIPGYEKELIRLMLNYGNDMVRYIGSICNEDWLENEDMQAFFKLIMDDFKSGKQISPSQYVDSGENVKQWLAEVMLEKFTPGKKYFERESDSPKTDAYRLAKSCLKSVEMSCSKRLASEISDKIKSSEGNELENLNKNLLEVQRNISRLQTLPFEQLYPNPKGYTKRVEESGFSYTLKSKK